MSAAFDPNRHHRRSIRLGWYDYAQQGAYFVTVCAQDRLCLFGNAADAGIHLNGAGEMLQRIWDEIPTHYPGVDVDTFAIMPNHIHGILHLVGAGPCACPPGPCACPPGPCACPPGPCACPPGPCACPQPRDTGQPRGVAPTGLGLADVVHRYKTMTTRLYAEGVKQDGWQPFPGRLWQRNYFEHIIRDERDLERVRQYIVDNPTRWATDPENRAAAPSSGVDR